eukprot:2038756-Amphidinium_carterae.1
MKESRNITPEARMAVYEYFGTFSRSLLSLFEMTLANWPPVARPPPALLAKAYAKSTRNEGQCRKAEAIPNFWCTCARALMGFCPILGILPHN